MPNHVSSSWFSLPFQSNVPVTANRIYLIGGYHSLDSGCPDWGTVEDYRSRFIGDCAGKILISYENGKIERIPLVFGYTMWFYENWKDCPAPFAGSDAIPEYKELLKQTLCLYGAYENAAHPVLCIKPDAEAIIGISVESNPEKEGKPIFWGGYFDDGTSFLPFAIDTPFFSFHTVSANQFPMEELNKLSALLVTNENAIETFMVLNDRHETVHFSGCPTANAANAIFAENFRDLRSKCCDSGLIHESSKNSPSWRYNGFGTWHPKADSYYGLMFSRNHKAATLLSLLAAPEASQKLIDFDHKKLLYFQENSMKINGKKIPGHWTVLINNPMWYSTELVPEHDWPTAYTRERFGADYKNMGNLEPDGHGLTMIAVYHVWNNTGRSVNWVNENWLYLNEAAAFIQWCLENPDVSFSNHGLLYGETEGGMMNFTLYNNVPCYIGLLMYAEMANAAGKSEAAQEWLRTAGYMETSILSYFSKEHKWILDKTGFYHDPTMPLCAEYWGYDAKNDFPQKWYYLAQNTFEDDLSRYTGKYFIGPRGTGYDHCIMTQSALLSDRPEVYEPMLENLCRICYAPDLPNPLIVPEAITYSPEKHCLRRQGDLGNLAQQAEALQTFLLAVGISGVRSRTLKLLPRLPHNWNVSVRDMKIPGSVARICYEISHPVKNVIQAKVQITGNPDIETIELRLGPFSKGGELIAKLNGAFCPVILEEIHHQLWGWVILSSPQSLQEYTIEMKQKNNP